MNLQPKTYNSERRVNGYTCISICEERCCCKRTRHNLQPGNGYIAITSAIIVTIIVVSVILTTSSIGYFGRFNVLGTLFKEEGNAFANACADTALLNLALDIDYAGNETITVASSTCTIMAIETNGDEKTIKTQAVENDRTSNLKVILDTTNFTIVSWDEVVTF